MKKPKRNNRLVHRSPKGFGASHPFIEKSSTNLGKNPFKEETRKEKSDTDGQRVKIAKKLMVKKMKITEDKIRNIVRQEIRQSLKEGFTWNGKKYYYPWEEEASFDPGESIFADAASAGVDNAVEGAEWLYDVNVQAAKKAREDAAKVGNYMTRPFVTAYDYWTGKGFSGTLEEFVEEFTDMVARTRDGYNNWLSEAKEAAGTRVPGSPPGSAYLIYEPWAREMIPYVSYDTVVRSSQLETKNIFEAIKKFYQTTEIGEKSTAFWWNSDSFPGYEGQIKWGTVEGTSLGSSEPHYEWLASQFSKYGIVSEEDMFQHLALYAPIKLGDAMRKRKERTDSPSDKPDAEDLLEVSASSNNVLYRSDFESPFFGLRSDAKKEIQKIKSAMGEMVLDESGSAVWRVFYGSRGFIEGPNSWLSEFRDTVEIASRLEGWTGTLFDIVAEIPIFLGHLGDAKQVCVFSHWTDDPRWIQNPVKPYIQTIGGTKGKDAEGNIIEKNIIEPCMTFKMP